MTSPSTPAPVVSDAQDMREKIALTVHLGGYHPADHPAITRLWVQELIERSQVDRARRTADALLSGPIAAMQAEHQREVERLQGLITTLMSQRADLRISLAALTAENERLRKALDIINRRASPDPQRTFDDASRDLYHIASRARSALARSEGGQDA